MARRGAYARTDRLSGGGLPLKRLRKILAWLFVLVAVLLTSAYLILRSDWMLEKVRVRILAELEKATGGRAEIGAIRFDWKLVQARASRVVLHGLEPADAPPLLKVEDLQVGLTINS